jgi:hypothetical protein
MLDALIAGPQLARRYIEGLEHVDWWTNELWADGGAVLDLTTRTLKFFGEELMSEIPERRAIMCVLPAMWPGFTVEWVYDGVNELAAHVGVDDPSIRFVPDKKVMPTLEIQPKKDVICHLVTVVRPDGEVCAWPLWSGSSAAWYGPRLLDKLPTPPPQPVTRGAIPDSGLHVDVGQRRVSTWLTRVEPGLLARLPLRWPGWQIEFWGDRYEKHLARCKSAVTVPELDLAAGLDEVERWLRSRIFQSFDDSPAGKVLELAQMLAPIAPGSTVSSCAISPSTTQPTAQEWAVVEEMFAHVRSVLRADGHSAGDIF